MQIDYKIAAVLVIVAGALAGGAYTLGVKHAEKKQAVPAAGKTAAPAQQAGTPAGHPVAAQAPASHPEPEREGKVSPDPSAKFVHFRVGNRNVKDVFVDGPVVWVGTSGGVLRYDTSTDQYKLWDNKTGLLSNGVFHVSRMDNRIWIGTYGGGLSILDPATGEWTNYNVPNGMADAFVYDVLRTRDGHLWIATWSGLNRVRGGALDDPSKWDTYTVENTQGGLPNDWVYGLAEGKDGEVWLATEGGLARFKDGKWTNWNHEKGLGAPYEIVKDSIEFKTDPAKQSEHHARQKQEMGLQDVSVAYNPNYIVALAVDRSGTVWAGTWGGGLSRFDGKKWKHYTVKEGLPANHVFMLHVDRNGILWVGTSKGLARMDGEKFKVFGTADGLYSETVFSMDISQDGSLWIGSYGGVTRLRL